MSKAKPCKNCPFLKQSAKGYLGESSFNPERFLSSFEISPIPCHKKVDWDNPKKKDSADTQAWNNPCIGSLDFMKNTFKSPRDNKYRNLVNKQGSKSELVFDSRQDFIIYHSKYT